MSYQSCWSGAACCSHSGGAAAKKVPRIGFLSNASSAADSVRYDAFRQGLRELGYVGGKNILIEYRSSEGRSDRLTALVAELLHLKVDIIVTTGPTVTRAAKEQPSRFPLSLHRKASGFVASLARPGGNLTGLSTLGPELSEKRLELLKEIVPTLSHVAVIGTSTIPAHARFLKEHERAAGAFGVKLQFLDVLDPKDIETAFRAANRGVLTDFWFCRVLCSILIEHRFLTSRWRAGFQRYTTFQNMWKLVDL